MTPWRRTVETHHRVPRKHDDPQPSRDPDLARCAAALEQIARILDEAIGVFLDSRFPHGRPLDRWGRRGA
jgi:hypothetical protein